MPACWGSSMTSIKQRLLATTLFAGLGLCIPTIVSAQSQPAPCKPGETRQADGKCAAPKGNQVSEVVVTGSRIRHSEFNSPAPIQVITGEDATLRGISSTGELLQESTIAASATQANGLVATGFVVTGGAGIESISLRGLGANRTLVLVDGRRAGPAGFSGTVGPFDLGVIPPTIIDRVEILKDGASSVYGSDAVAGVVNIITKSRLDGLDLDIRSTQPTAKGGGQEYRASASWGKVFDRGYFNITGDYWEQEPLRLKDRHQLNCTTAYRFSATGQRMDIIDPTTGEPKCEATLSNAIELNATGVVVQPSNLFAGPYPPEAFGPYFSPYVGVQPMPAGYAVTGGTDNFGNPDPATFGYEYNDPRGNDYSLLPLTKRSTIFANGALDLTPSVQAYGQFLFNRRDQNKYGWRQFFPAIAPAFAAPADHNPFQDIAFPLSLVPSNEHDVVDYTRVLGGLRGDFGGMLPGWRWDLWGQYSLSQASYTHDVILDDAAWALGDLTSAYKQTHGANFLGAAGCPGGVTPISHRSCININLFGANELRGLFSPAEEAFLFDQETGHTRYDSAIVEGTANGGLFNLPAGEVKLAVGFQVRRDSLKDTPGPDTLAHNLWGQTTAGVTQGSDTVNELFGELYLPLFKDQPLARDMNLTLSSRYSHYASYGSSSTYKAAFNWAVTPQWRLRTTLGTSFRAPELYELYLAHQTSFAGQSGNDPCFHYSTNPNLSDTIKANCAASGVPSTYPTTGTSSMLVSAGGGKGLLKAESSKSITEGLIWTPTFADLNLIVDYWQIEIDNEVTRFGVHNILYGCYNSPNFPTDPLCSLFTRDMTPGSPTQYQITTINDNYINIAKQKSRGFDVTLGYRHDLPFDLKMHLQQEATFTLSRSSRLFGLTATDNNGRIGFPAFVGNTEMDVHRGPWTFFWNVLEIGDQSEADFTNPISHNPLYPPVNYRKARAEFTAFHDVSVQRNFGQDTAVTLGVRNLFDERPPNVSDSYSSVGNTILESQYMEGFLGREVFFDIAKRF